MVASGRSWEFRDEPGRRTVAAVSMTPDQMWRLLSNNLRDGPKPEMTGEQMVVDIVVIKDNVEIHRSPGISPLSSTLLTGGDPMWLLARRRVRLARLLM